jgi:hypothetical protein
LKIGLYELYLIFRFYERIGCNKNIFSLANRLFAVPESFAQVIFYEILRQLIECLEFFQPMQLLDLRFELFNGYILGSEVIRKNGGKEKKQKKGNPPKILLQETILNRSGLRVLSPMFHPKQKRSYEMNHNSLILNVGAAGFEPAAPCSQSRCANRTALRPESFWTIW